MEIRILGPGCPRCGEVEKRTINVLAELNVGADVQKITDIKKISEYKVFATPARLSTTDIIQSRFLLR